MQLEIVTPGKKIFSGEVKLVQLPGNSGSFELLKNHAPIISSLKKGKVKIITNAGEENTFDITGGVVESINDHVIVLAES